MTRKQFSAVKKAANSGIKLFKDAITSIEKSNTLANAAIIDNNIEVDTKNKEIQTLSLETSELNGIIVKNLKSIGKIKELIGE